MALRYNMLWITLVMSCVNALAQKDSTQVFLNHVFIVLDSNVYKNVFDSPFLEEIGDTAEKTTSTTNESWSGKYFRGRDSYFELFPPNGLQGSKVGSVGFGFMTFKQGDIDKVFKAWKSRNKDSIRKDTTSYLSNGKKTTWFYSVELDSPDTLLSTNIWVMENTPDELKSVGFTSEEIERPISWKEYVEKRSKKKFTKPFNRITNVELITNKKEFEYLRKSFLGFGLNEHKNHFFNDYISIDYLIADIKSTSLKKVEIELSKSFKERTILVGTDAKMHIKGNRAALIFY